jgi:hypothetical protein
MAVKPPTNPASAEPGYLTTEFWLTSATSVISILVTFNVVHITTSQTQSIMGLLGMIVPIAIYAISRGLRKSGTPA